ncbi:Ldh family oxidoreductase [Candidatus Saccharibacteria bacterium]|nr:Ldh family oxidoreductase [Candidatus Saccharibacteria bacterium]
MKVQVADLKQKVLSGVTKLGYEGDDAQIIADTLLYAQLRGNNQGITKIATGGVPRAADVQELTTVKEDRCGALLSGGHSMVATHRAAEKAMDIARQHGVGIVGVNHTFSSSGAIGFFSRQMAKQGFLGFVYVGNGGFSFVAPAGSSEGKLGTNPLSYAFPYNGGEVVFDNATAAMAYFGIVEAKLKGEAIPEGIGFSSDGQPSTNASEVLDGAIATFAEHKGYGLSILVQLLGGPFTLAGTPGVNEDDGSGTFVMAIDPGLLAGKDEFMSRSTAMVDQLKQAKPLPGQVVTLPGERGDNLAKQAEESGEIEIADAIWNELLNFVDN